MRIVSLLPSTTEILFALGAGDDVVGVTFECDFPAAARTRRIVSSTTLAEGLSPVEIDTAVRRAIADGEDLYRLDEGALRELDADLVITQDLCAVCAVDADDVASALDHLGCSATVLTIDPHRLTDVLASIVTIGNAVGRSAEARALVARLQDRLAAVAAIAPAAPARSVAVVEWTDPPFTAGHWVPDLVAAAGGRSVGGAAGGRSTETTWDAVAAADPDVIIIAPCGYDLPAASELARGLIDDRRLPAGRPVWAIDANAVVVRPGPRLVDGVETIAAMLAPDRFPPRTDLAVQVAT